MSAKLKNKKIAVLCGGKSRERAVSLRSGSNVFNSLKRQGFKVIQIDPFPNGKPPKTNLIEQLKNKKIELVYLALHGAYGEDGTIQGLLEYAGIPYTGSGVLASSLAMHKVAAKMVLQSAGVITPKWKMIDPKHVKANIAEVIANFPLPLVVKPTSEGSSFGVTIVKREADLDKVIRKTIKEFREVFVEEFISGQEITIGVLGTGAHAFALPILELVPKGEFYDFESKYTPGGTNFILPARLSKELTKKAQDQAVAAHNALGCSGVSRVDMIVGPNNLPYVHEVNSIPGMTDQSDLPAEAASAGISFDRLVVKILESAIKK